MMLFIISLMFTTGYGCRVSVSCVNGTLSEPELSTAFASEICSQISLTPTCHVDSLSPFLLINQKNVYELNLSQCNATEVMWQSVISSGVNVDLSRCPLSCSCVNSYMAHLPSHHIRLKLPMSYSCGSEHEKCAQGQVLPRNEILNIEIGTPLEIKFTIDEGIVYPELINKNRQYFIFPEMERHNGTEVVTPREIRLNIESATEDLIGHVKFICWHCGHPISSSVEIHIAKSLEVTIVDDESNNDLSHLVVSGHPINSLSLTVTDSTGKFNSSHALPVALKDDSPFNLFGTLFIRPETAHWSFHKRVFSIYVRYPLYTIGAEHDQIISSGNFTFKICNHINEAHNPVVSLFSDNNTETFVECGTAYHYLNISKNSSIIENLSSNQHVHWIIILICIIILLPFVIYPNMKFLRSRIIRNKGFKFQMASRLSRRLPGARRTSISTEETMLRLEERASLSSSDYSGQIIPSINGASIQIHERIGKGAFGEVYCGTWDIKGERSVAVKAIYQADEQIEKEAQVLCSLDHPNIVRLYGMTRDGSKLLLVFEMMNLGDLRSYLKSRAPQATNYSQFPPALTLDEQKFILREIAKGVHYLGAQQIVHRDLAARNCLVSGKSDLRCTSASQRPPTTVKISDFGMSRRLNYQSEYYQMMNQSLLPVRWLPPEAISHHKFSHASDIWALGVTMWEVFSYGEVPFDTLTNDEVVSYAMAGMRPPKPNACPAEIYEVMEKCWAMIPDERISIEDILLHPSISAITDMKTSAANLSTYTVADSSSSSSPSTVKA